MRADDDLWRTLEIDQGALDDLIDELVVIRKGAAVDIRQVSAPIATVADLAKAVWQTRETGGSDA